MRETCLFCASKHIAQAIVLVTESCLGYPLHIWLAIGHLAEAESETCSMFPFLSQQIRCVRLALMGQEGVFVHEELMDLLKTVRKVAEGLNGVSEEARVQGILYAKLEG